MKDLLQAIVFGGLFLIPLLPFYVENDFFFPFITGKNFAFRIIVEIVFASWILLALFDTRYRPKFSWILPAFGSLLVVMFFANWFGEYPLKSFMSNFERMDGYVTLVHVFLYTLVLGSVLTTQKLWSYFLHTSLAVALLVALYGLGQQTGLFEGGRDRVDSRLGNAAYMAVYMLFHIFFTAFLALRSKVKAHQIGYAVVGLILAYTLLQTGTRGTFLGLVGGMGAAVAYVALFGRRVPQLRKYAIGGVFALVVASLLFIGVRDTDYVQNTGPLARIANIDLQEDLVVRTTIWGLAWEGVQERPLLGWGQGNFNYVFNEKYEPSLYAQEQWFDRVHNIFFDWLIAGGFLGFIAYFSIMAAVVYYLLIRPVFMHRESSFSVLENAVLFGLVVGYLMHNLVVFDNIISYIFYGTLLALVHMRVAKPIPKVEAYNIAPQMVTQFATPIVIIVAGFSVYFVNVPGIVAAGDIIDALTASTVTERLEEFNSALEQDSFADQEIVEQLAQQAMTIVRNQNISPEEKQAITMRAELELLRLAEEKPGDARIHNFMATFYRAIGAIPQAREQADIALSLSPEKPSLFTERAIIELQAGQPAVAAEFLKEGFELAEENTRMRVLYGAALMQAGETEAAKELIGESYKEDFALNNYALSSVENAGELEYLAELFTIRVAEQPDNAQHRASLAFIYYQLGDTEAAIEVLEAGAEAVPAFAPRAQCYVANLEAGSEPGVGCDEL
jgi:O-antigen ligase/tetratricopeptide (TPR) repeat protein